MTAMSVAPWATDILLLTLFANHAFNTFQASSNSLVPCIKFAGTYKARGTVCNKVTSCRVSPQCAQPSSGFYHRTVNISTCVVTPRHYKMSWLFILGKCIWGNHKSYTSLHSSLRFTDCPSKTDTLAFSCVSRKIKSNLISTADISLWLTVDPPEYTSKDQH